ncbi:MAG: aminodeoxychorismate synthase, component I [Micrococcales bacterium 73-13]|nr:MAG: aminodeoxychorismate synthase, component I [Micrococcales bacterium 73-13]
MRDRVLVHEVPGVVDAEAAFAALYADRETAFWLDSGSGGAGTSFLGAAEWTVDAEEIRARGGDVLGWLRAERARWDVDASAVDGGFALGIVGWFGYELYAETMGLGAAAPRRYPDALFLRVDRALAIDHATGRARLLARGRGWDGELAAWRDRALSLLAAAPEPQGPEPAAGERVRWAYSDAEYLAMIRECQHAIAEGDAYVLCLTTEARIDGAFDPWEVYRRLRRISPSHHGAFLRAGPVALLSASPEQFLRVDRDGWVETKPIKGTRPRGATPDDDDALREALRRDEKERAENVMIVDLMRNDLSRVCRVGTVEVVKLLDVETYPQVHQLVSTVGGRLAAGRDAVHAIGACFPAGSMTGAPKHSAVSILARLEHRSRGIYSGAFGYLGYDGAVDLAMTIRSIVVDAEGATVGTGGGITALSVPEEELAETRLKAAALLAALGASDGTALPAVVP